MIKYETCDPPNLISFYDELTCWKNNIRKKINIELNTCDSDIDLFLVDPITNAQVKIFLGPEELKKRVHYSDFDDNKDEDYSHLVFVPNPDGVEGIQNVKIDDESFSVIPVSNISKFIFRRSNSTAQNLREVTDVRFSINPYTVYESFKADFNQLKLNSVDFIRGHASVYSYLYKKHSKFYVPMSCLCQCSGAGKSKSATTVLKETPGFYVCIREPESETLFAPRSNNATNALLEIFDIKNGKYISDSLSDQNDLLCETTTIGKCLMFVAQSIKSYLVTVANNLASKLHGNEDAATLSIKLLAIMKEYSSNNFESFNSDFEFLSGDSLQNDFLEASFKKSEKAKVSHVVDYILKILQNSENCFNFDIELKKKLLENNSNLSAACKAISAEITSEKPFLFFIDEAGLLSKMVGYKIGSKKIEYSAFQIFRRALSYLDMNTNIFFFALGTKSTIEELSPRIIDSSFRALPRKEFFPPIILTQDFDIWREKYPLNEMVPCYKTLLNCCTFKFLATLGHPMFSSFNFADIVQVVLEKLYNGSKATDKTYILATWMIRGGLACDPKSVLAESLVENHMATLFNIKPHANSSSASYDITYQSIPCLALAARSASSNLGLEEKFEFFHRLENKIESMVVDRGKLGEATGGLLTALLIDKLTNCAQFTLTDALINEMKTLTAKKFHPLWDARGSLLCPIPDPSKIKNDFNDYKVVKVRSFLETLMGKKDFERIKEILPIATLDGLINASHFVSISRIDESFSDKVQLFPNANDLVYDNFRNVITMDRLRLALARQCGLIMPPNYYGIDAIIPVCLAKEEVIDPQGNITIEDVKQDRANGIPYEIYDPSIDSNKNRYRPIYSFIGIQYKSGRFDLDAIPKMQARLHIVPCVDFSTKDATGIHVKCQRCVSDLALKEIFDNQISLLYCFLSSENSNFSLRKQYTVNYGPDLGNFDAAPAAQLSGKENFLKVLYPNISENLLKSFTESTAKLVQSNSVRTFDDFFLRHRVKVNENVELINIYSDETQGCTYRACDVKKWENGEHLRRLEMELANKKRKVDVDQSSPQESSEKAPDTQKLDKNESAESLAAGIASVNITGEKDSSSSLDSSATKYPNPVSLPTHLKKSRMSTVIINGWKPWEPVIGSKGVKMADKLFKEFVQDPLRNIDERDRKIMCPSLKMIMSSKLLGLDRYLELQTGQDDISNNEWLCLLFERFSDVTSPEDSGIYRSARQALDTEEDERTKK